MRYPHFLKQNGTIGMPAPSYGAASEPYTSRLKSAIGQLESMGFRVAAGPNAFEGKGIGISNTPQLCARELEQMYSDKDTDALISVGGGELMCETLSAMDLGIVANADPKWFVGYSDNTNFHYVLNTMFDTASVYGINAATFGMQPWHESLNDMLDILTGRSLSVHGYDKWEVSESRDADHPLAPYDLTERTELKFFNYDSPVGGRFIGGCLDVLIMLCGTRFDKTRDFCRKYEKDGIIYYLEACDLTPVGIRRALWQLENAGWFENVNAFLFGRPACLPGGADYTGLDEYSAVMGMLEKYNVPVIMDADIGHLAPSMPIISGAYGTLRRVGSSVAIDFELR